MLATGTGEETNDPPPPPLPPTNKAAQLGPEEQVRLARERVLERSKANRRRDEARKTVEDAEEKARRDQYAAVLDRGQARLQQRMMDKAEDKRRVQEERMATREQRRRESGAAKQAKQALAAAAAQTSALRIREARKRGDKWATKTEGGQWMFGQPAPRANVDDDDDDDDDDDGDDNGGDGDGGGNGDGCAGRAAPLSLAPGGKKKKKRQRGLRRKVVEPATSSECEGATAAKWRLQEHRRIKKREDSLRENGRGLSFLDKIDQEDRELMAGAKAWRTRMKKG